MILMEWGPKLGYLPRKDKVVTLKNSILQCSTFSLNQLLKSVEFGTPVAPRIFHNFLKFFVIKNIMLP
jgi:hypothetical protein